MQTWQCQNRNTATPIMILCFPDKTHLQSAPTASRMDLKPSLSKHAANSAYKPIELKWELWCMHIYYWNVDKTHV